MLSEHTSIFIEKKPGFIQIMIFKIFITVTVSSNEFKTTFKIIFKIAFKVTSEITFETISETTFEIMFKTSSVKKQLIDFIHKRHSI